MKLLVLGHAQHGKDTVADYIALHLGLLSTSSSKFAIEDWIFEKDSKNFKSPDDMYERRNEIRTFLFEEIKQSLAGDLSSLGRKIFKNNDIYVGCRNSEEVIAIQNAGLVDLTIFVDASERKEPESKESCNITKELADIIIDNNSTVEVLEKRLYNFCRIIKK